MKTYELMIKIGGSWTSVDDAVDAIDGRAPTKDDYLKILEEAGNEAALIEKIRNAEDFRAVERYW